MSKFTVFFVFVSFSIFQHSCKSGSEKFTLNNDLDSTEKSVDDPDLPEDRRKISDAALSIVDKSILYDPTYFNIDYPNGDVPAGKGVCTDVIIRTYRKLGIDLQREVHEDMKANFSLYPKTWGLSKPDTNIDHRRVPNLMVYFSRFGEEKPMIQNGENYQPGNIVCWRLANGMTHIGIVVNEKSKDRKRYKIVHNIGGGQVLEDVLFDYEIIGHYFYGIPPSSE